MSRFIDLQNKKNNVSDNKTKPADNYRRGFSYVAQSVGNSEKKYNSISVPKMIKKTGNQSRSSLFLIGLGLLTAGVASGWWMHKLKNKQAIDVGNVLCDNNQEKSQGADVQDEGVLSEDVWDVGSASELPLAENKSWVGRVLMMAKRDGHIVAMTKNLYDGTSNILFEFENNAQSDQRDVRFESDFNGDLSADKKNIVYISNDGLELYDIEKREKRTIIGRGHSSDLSAGLTPGWSVEELKNVLSISQPRWSNNGKYISFVKNYANGHELAVFDLDKNRLLSIGKTGAGSLSGLNTQWDNSSKTIFDLELSENESSGLYAISGADFGVVENFSEKIGIKGADLFEFSLSLAGQKAAFIFEDSYAENDFNKLGIADLNGNTFTVIENNSYKSVPFFSFEGGKIYFLIELEDEGVMLSSMDIATGEKTKLATLPKNYFYWHNPEWINEGKILAIEGITGDPSDNVSASKKLYLVLDIENNTVVKSFELQEDEYIIESI